jgi:outer membrane protein assembly factor BamB
MKNAFIRTALITAVMVAVIMTILPASANDWVQFQKDNMHTGRTTDGGPIFNSPNLIWSEHTTGTGMGGIDVAPIVGDGDVYVIDYQGILWSFDAMTGVENWNTDLTQGFGTFELSTPAYHDGMIYAAVSGGDEGEGRGRVSAIYADTGAIRESCYYGSEYYQINTPVTYSDGKVYFGNWRGTVPGTLGFGTYFCVNADNVCDQKWSWTSSYGTGYYRAGAAIAGNYIIFGDDSANVTCLNKNDGTLIDYFNISRHCGCSDPVEKIRSSIVWNADDGCIYFTANYLDNAHGGYGTGHLYAVPFNAASGDLGGDNNLGGGSCKWNYDLWNSKSTPVYYDGRIYVGGGYKMYSSVHTGKICCIDESDGSLIWEWSNPSGRVSASPALSVVNGRKFIYFTTNVADGSAYCLEDMGDTYEVRWIWDPPYPDEQWILHGMAVADGVIYFGTDFGELYALAGICGDVNCDGYVTAADVHPVFMRVYCSKWAADVNCDSFVTTADAYPVFVRILNCCIKS